MTNKILVTPRSITRDGHPSLDKLRAAGFEIICCTPGEQPKEEELRALVGDCVGWLAGVEKITAAVLAAAPRLRVISRNGTGVNNVDLATAEQLGIKVCRADGANARGVAELTFGLMLSLARSIPFSDQAIKQGGWGRRKGVELEERTLGLLGCGKIGKLVAQMALAFGMRVLAYDPLADESFKPGNGFSFCTMEDLLAQADFISLHCPLLDGKPVITEEVLLRTKRGAYLINTARGELMDWPAVQAAVQDGRLAGVAVDAYLEEPPLDRSLLASDKVIATPHAGALTEESVDRAVSVAVDNLLAILQKEPISL